MNNRIETAVGLLVILISAWFVYFTYKTSNTHKFDHTYTLKAKFDQVDGVVTGSDVMISGIKVGTVDALELDSESYDAVMTIKLKSSIKVPADSSIQVTTSGFLKDKYVSINMGSDEELLQPGGEIKFTQSSVSIEALLGKLLYNLGGNNKEQTKKN